MQMIVFLSMIPVNVLLMLKSLSVTGDASLLPKSDLLHTNRVSSTASMSNFKNILESAFSSN